MLNNHLWDPNDDKKRLFEKFEKFYGEFSDNTRKDMQSRNVLEPSNAYDVLYPESREKLLSKNVPVVSDIIEDTEVYRQAALAKIVPVVTDIEAFAEAYRKAQLAKNVVNESSVLEIAERYRHEQLAKNEEIRTESHISKSQDFRQNQLSKNVAQNSDIEKDTEVYRQQQLANNVPQNSDIVEDTEEYRKGQLSNNVPQTSDIEEDTEVYRQQQLSNNVPQNSDIEQDTEDYRQAQLSNNVPQNSDIEEDTEVYRQQQLSNNVPQTSDIEEDTEVYRQQQLSNNVPQTSDIEQDTEDYRQAQLANNVPQTSDIEQDTEDFRQAQLGNNVPANSDLESDTEPYREQQLGNNVPQTSDIEQDTEAFRQAQLGNNVTSNSDLESDTEDYRKTQLGNNVPQTSDIEQDTQGYRDAQLGNNVPSNSDLETDSVPFREADLGNNVPSNSDLETDSVPFREADLGNNVPSNSDLEEDSVPFRESDLSNNVPNNSDLETDSVPYREDDLSNNVPSNSDLEEDSVPFREDDLSNNVPSNSDLLEDSVPFREDDLSNNVPSNSDLLEDSIPYREDDLSNNVPSETDLLEDSEVYREEDLANNVPSTSDLLTDTLPYLQEQLSANVGAVSDIEEDSEMYRETMLANNVPAFSNVLADSEDYRDAQLSRNLQGSLFGLNVEGFGTQAFIGVSRNFAFGILVREALLTRNKYTSEQPYNADLEGGVLESVFTGYYQRLAHLEIEEMHLKNGQESSGYRIWTGQAPIIKKDASRSFGVDYHVNRTPVPSEDLTGDQLAAKLQAGNPLLDEEFVGGPKSIKNVIDKITQSNNVAYAQNYLPGQTEFVIGTKPDGAPRFARQRYSVTNPYAAEDAGDLVFSITNYAIQNTNGIGRDGLAEKRRQLRTMYFPPYIQSFQENETANWNENLMLGRPEPVFTYNNSRREGSINFYVLTDYAQQVELGVFDNGEGLESLIYDFENFHMTDVVAPDESVLSAVDESEAEMVLKQKQLQEVNAQINTIQREADEALRSALSQINPRDTDASQAKQDAFDANSTTLSQANPLKEQAEALASEASELERRYNQALVEKGSAINNLNPRVSRFSENFAEGGNIYNTLITPDGSSTLTSTRDVAASLDALKQGLAFQPAFFSGDKVDFRRRMSFLSKLTRPREKSGLVGFSFTVPPIAHIRLGDWINHDCIINSVNKDYSDTVWCLQRGSVQPLWSLVTISFTLIGSYGEFGRQDQNFTRPLTSSDVGGYYGDRHIW